MKKAIISGVAGQDGSYLADLLIEKGYEVHGIVRPESIESTQKLGNIAHLNRNFILHPIGLENQLALVKVIQTVQPDECYHLASSSFVNYAVDAEVSIMQNNFVSTYNLLSTLKEICPNCRVYFAGSSEMFGQVGISPQDEETPFNPRSIYGISKLAGYHLARNYREQNGIFVCTGILFNHESHRRGMEFVTRKITLAAARIKTGMDKTVRLGNLEAVRDWGYAPEYVEAMWRMLQQSEPMDYVIATGKLHSVKEFLDIAFGSLGLDYEDYVISDPTFYRPSETVPLCGSSLKAETLLGWKPQKCFSEMVQEMVEYDYKELLGGQK